MNLIIDARALRLYAVGQPGFHGGTELMVQEVARGLAKLGHTVHVVTPDLGKLEQRSEREWWWPPVGFPAWGDAVVLVHSLEHVDPYHADLLIFATNGVDPDLGPKGDLARGVDAFACFSQTHVDLMTKLRPTIDPAKCFVTGLGVNPQRYVPAEGAHGLRYQPGRLLYANDPARGLWHVLDIFDRVRAAAPEATLGVAYDFDRQFQAHRWQSSAQAEFFWEMRRRLDLTPGVENLGALTPEQLTGEQLRCQVHVMPSDPPNLGSQIHGLTQLECAAAGCALVLSDTEAFPEVFGGVAEILPLPGAYLPDLERRVDAQDWADVVVAIIQDEARYDEMSKKSLMLAWEQTWDAVSARWDRLLGDLAGVAA